MANQNFDQQHNIFWMDLHKCATNEATSIINKRLKECYKYGIRTLEVIYGTPDSFEGSIQAALTEITQNHPLIEEVDEIHAGIVIVIKINPAPLTQDEEMFFCGFEASYENWHQTFDHVYDYFPFRKVFTTFEISKNIRCPVEYVRNAAKDFKGDFAELKTVYSEYNHRDETTWYIYKSGYEFIQNKWQKDKEAVLGELKVLNASDEEIDSVINTFKTPLSSKQKVKSRVSAALKRLRTKGCQVNKYQK